MAAMELSGKTPMLIAVDGMAAGAIAVADTIKNGSADAVKALRGMGLDVIMITGDNRPTAEAVARRVGIKRVLAEVLPDGKSLEIKRLQQEEKKVAGMVGVLDPGAHEHARVDRGEERGNPENPQDAGKPVTGRVSRGHGSARAERRRAAPRAEANDGAARRWRRRAPATAAR